MIELPRNLMLIYYILIIFTIQQETIGCLEEEEHQEEVGQNSTEEQGASHSLVSSNIENRQHYHSLPKLKLNQDIYTPKQMELVNTFFYGADSLHSKKTISDFGYMAMMTKLHTLSYNDIIFHKYDDFQDLKVSGGPNTDQDLCIKQLENLNERAKLHNIQKFESKDINLHQLLDTYGRVPAGMLVGQGLFTGYYTECLRLKIREGDNEEIISETRYCVASFKHRLWPKKGLLSPYSVLKAGVCIPRTCDSTNYKNKWSLIEDLTHFNARTVDKDQIDFLELYCLPDKDSSIRVWWKQPKTVALVTLLTAWFSILVYSTYKYKELCKSMNQRVELEEDSFGLTGGLKVKKQSKEQNSQHQTYIKIYQSLSITHNMKKLFNTTKKSALLETAQIDIQEDSDEEEIMKKETVVDLSVLEGIKVLCMCYVVMGHVLMCLTPLIANGRELTSIGMNNVSFFISNLVPAFAVNSFFTITGILTTYLLFKNKQSQTLIKDGRKWFALIIYRYLRIMPMYVVVVAYTKYLAKYMGEGPFWDYATSSISARGKCERESWLWTLLFGANFKPPLDHCIPSAWYLANDFQFFIVTPIFLVALNRHPRFGCLLLKFCIAAGVFAGFLSILFSEAEDLRPIVSFEPHGFNTYITFLSASYTRPQYRIPAYLCGLLIGFMLFEFERNKIKYLIAKAKGVVTDEKLEKPDWSETFKKYGFCISLFSVALCCALPLLSSYIHFSKFFAKVSLALFMSSYHLIFSLSIGTYVLLATTGYSNQFVNNILSAPLWKPLARLSLSVVLINVEVISYVLHTNTQIFYLTFTAHSALNIICIIYTYLVAIAVCVLFEAPMRAALNHLVAHLVAKVASKRKVH